MSKNWLFWGRVFYSIPLSITGFIYIWKPQGTVESLTSFIPGELALIYGAGVLWLILGLLIALNIKTRLAIWGIIGLLSAYFIMVHIPAIYTGEYLNIVWFELLRDLSLLGGAFLIMSNQLNEQEVEHEADTHDWQATHQ
jgi:uncharacterized membrane protein YphA (DoxX/SURF4 family)